VTGQVARMGYPCVIFIEKKGEVLEPCLQVSVPISTLCPCSKAISDFGAHNQRAIARIQVTLKPGSTLSFQDLIAYADDAASCPVFPLLKRADEKWVTERQYTNPKFVEDVARDLVLLLRDQSALQGFSVKVEALESIHAHNAWAAHHEGTHRPFI
jgi:GTP cyclohydrolase IB